MCPRRVMSGVSALRRALGGDTRQRLHAACTARADVADALLRLPPSPAPFSAACSLLASAVSRSAHCARVCLVAARGSSMAGVSAPRAASPTSSQHGQLLSQVSDPEAIASSTSETHKEGRLSSGAVGSMGLCGARARGLMGHGLGGVINRTSDTRANERSKRSCLGEQLMSELGMRSRLSSHRSPAAAASTSALQ